jgi:hypothetical protein
MFEKFMLIVASMSVGVLVGAGVCVAGSESATESSYVYEVK